MESSNSAGAGGPCHRSWKRRRLVPNLTKPVRFVSTGTAMPGLNLNRAAAPSTPVDTAAPSTQIDSVEFDKYGSFALNMMLKMGFKTGSGLRKHEQGIIAIETSQGGIAEIEILWVDLNEDIVKGGALVVDVNTHTAKDDVSRIASGLKREREKLVCQENEKFCGGIGSKEIIDSGLERMQDDLLSGALTLDSMLETLKHLKEMFEEEYKLCNLSIMALSYAYPLLVEVFVGWEPLQNPMHGLELMLSWRDLLLDVDTNDNVAGSSLFELLVSEVILPAVLVSVTNTWQVCEPEPMIRFLESWDALLPAQVRQSILDDIVMPKLSAAVESWNAMPKTVPIDAWIDPWLPLLGQRLEVFYDKIRF